MIFKCLLVLIAMQLNDLFSYEADTKSNTSQTKKLYKKSLPIKTKILSINKPISFTEEVTDNFHIVYNKNKKHALYDHNIKIEEEALLTPFTKKKKMKPLFLYYKKGYLANNAIVSIYIHKIKTKSTLGGKNGLILGDASISVKTSETLSSVSIRHIKNKKENYIFYFPGIPKDTKDGLALSAKMSSNDTLQWFLTYNSFSYRGECLLKQTSKYYPIGLYLTPSKHPQEISSFTIRKLLQSKELKAKYAFKELTHKYNPKFHPQYQSSQLKYDRNHPATKYLVLKSIQGPLHKEEIAGLENYLLNYGKPTINWLNYYFRRTYMPYMLEWVWEKKNNQKLINQSIQMAQSVIAHRSDKLGDEGIYTIGQVPVWPHYRGVQFLKGKMTLSSGFASFGSALSWITVPSKLIANNKNLWDQTTSINNKNYKQIAYELIDEAMVTIDFTLKHYLEKKTKLLKSPAWGAEPEGWVPQWNRSLPFITALIPLIDAMKAFKIHPKKIVLLEEIVKRYISYFLSYVKYYDHNGKTVLNYPYGDYRTVNNPEQSEDIGHAGFDGRQLQMIYKAKRYSLKEKFPKAYANTLADIVCKGNGVFKKRLKGDRTFAFTYFAGLEGLIWLAHWRPELYEHVIEYTYNKVLKKRLDSRFVWEVLKLKEQKQQKK